MIAAKPGMQIPGGSIYVMLVHQVLDAIGAELSAPGANDALRKRVVRPLMLMVMWEVLPWIVGAWAIATLCSSLATTAALRVFSGAA